MKMLMVLVDADHAGEVERLLDQNGVPGYTLIANARGKGRTGRKLGNRAFPGSSMLYWVALPEGECRGLCDELRQLRDSTGPEEGLKAYVFETTEVI
jgi:hypothetical protein